MSGAGPMADLQQKSPVSPEVQKKPGSVVISIEQCTEWLGRQPKQRKMIIRAQNDRFAAILAVRGQAQGLSAEEITGSP